MAPMAFLLLIESQILLKNDLFGDKITNIISSFHKYLVALYPLLNKVAK